MDLRSTPRISNPVTWIIELSFYNIMLEPWAENGTEGFILLLLQCILAEKATKTFSTGEIFGLIKRNSTD